MTGLRKEDIGSLTPANFELDSDHPTPTVEAKHSNHRKKDTLPLHADIVVVMRKWLLGLAIDEPLFPLLGNEKHTQ
jgi:integrase